MNSIQEEPSYLAFARANARDGVATTATVVRELVARIDRDAPVVKEMRERKPRTVSTIEDLGALPFETVIRDSEGHVLERWGDAEHVQWSTPGCKWFVPADQIALPVTVLYEVQP